MIRQTFYTQKYCQDRVEFFKCNIPKRSNILWIYVSVILLNMDVGKITVALEMSKALDTVNIHKLTI